MGTLIIYYVLIGIGPGRYILRNKSVLWNYDAVDLHMHLYSNFCLHVCTLTHTASQDLNAENSSLGDILEESDWDVNSDVAMATEGRGGALMKRSLQSEKEIR